MKLPAFEGLLRIDFDDPAAVLPSDSDGLLGEWRQALEGEARNLGLAGLSPGIGHGACSGQPAFAATFSSQVWRGGGPPVSAMWTNVRPTANAPRMPASALHASSCSEEIRELAWRIVREVTGSLELDQREPGKPRVRLRLDGQALAGTEVCMQREGPQLCVVITCGSRHARDLIARHMAGLRARLDGAAPEVRIELLFNANAQD